MRLPDRLLTRVRLFYGVLEEVIGMPFEQVLDNLRRDLEPQREVEVWEGIAADYLHQLEQAGPELGRAAAVVSLAIGIDLRRWRSRSRVVMAFASRSQAEPPLQPTLALSSKVRKSHF